MNMDSLSRLRERAEPWLEKADAMSVRERLLILLTGLALIGAAWHTLFMAPLLQQADRSQAELAALESRIMSANDSLQEQILQLAGGSDEQRSRIASLQRRIEEINSTLGDHAAELIDPSEMARVLEGVLRQQSRLSLVRIRNTSPEFLTSGEEQNAVTFYRHGLEIEVEGSYAACLEYLDAIEALPWRLYWQMLELEVIDYPNNRIRLEVSTLSLDEGWIGA